KRARESQAREQAARADAVPDEIGREAEQLVATLSVEERRDAVPGRLLEQRALEDVPGPDQRQVPAQEILERECVGATGARLDLNAREPECLGKQVDST